MNEKQIQAEAIARHRREVDISFDLNSIEKSLRLELEQYGEIEALTKSIKGGLVVRYKTRDSAQKLLDSYKEEVKPARLRFRVKHVIIKQHCLYFKPTPENNWTINQDMLNATQQYFSTKVEVQQVRRMRESILVVFYDQEVRNNMLEQHPTPIEILGAHIGPCAPGLPPAINKKRRAKAGKPKVRKNVNEAN